MHARHAFLHCLLAVTTLVNGGAALEARRAPAVQGYGPARAVATGELSTDIVIIEDAEVLPGIGRRLLHGCHRRKCVTKCPRCALPTKNTIGHCRRRGRMHSCHKVIRGTAREIEVDNDGDEDSGGEGNEGDEGSTYAFDDGDEGNEGDEGDEGNEGIDTLDYSELDYVGKETFDAELYQIYYTFSYPIDDPIPEDYKEKFQRDQSPATPPPPPPPPPPPLPPPPAPPERKRKPAVVPSPKRAPAPTPAPTPAKAGSNTTDGYVKVPAGCVLLEEYQGEASENSTASGPGSKGSDGPAGESSRKKSSSTGVGKGDSPMASPTATNTTGLNITEVNGTSFVCGDANATDAEADAPGDVETEDQTSAPDATVGTTETTEQGGGVVTRTVTRSAPEDTEPDTARGATQFPFPFSRAMSREQFFRWNEYLVSR